MKLIKDLSQREFDRVEELLTKMTLDEKIGQLNQPNLFDDKAALGDLVREGKVGSLVLAYSALAGTESRKSQLGFRQELQRIAIEESPSGIPILFGRDVIHGHRTVFPIPLMQAHSWNVDLVEKASSTAAKEAIADDIHWTFAPMMDIARDPRWGRIIEGFGEDPHLASEMAVAMIKGFQSAGIAACAKHFVAYGASEGGRDYNTTEVSDYTLRNIYLPPFAASVRAGVLTVMASFNDISGEAVTGSRRLLTGLLKEELGFEGFVVSDWDAVGQLIRQGAAADRRAAAAIAINAGIDMDMVSNCFIDHLPELVKDGTVSESRLNDAVRRVLLVKSAVGLLDLPDNRTPMQAPVYELNVQLAHDAAASGMVLLKNEFELLPLPVQEKKIALLGQFLNEQRSMLGSWTLDGRAEDVQVFEECMKQTAPELIFINAASGSADAAVEAAIQADVVIVALGEDWNNTGEARGHAGLLLPDEQLDLLCAVNNVNKNIVSVIFSGRPLIFDEVSQLSKAVLYAGHSGTAAASAAASILFGLNDPCGKLSVTFPRNAGQIPIYYNQRSAGRDIDNYYGKAVFKNYQDCEDSPMYPFGYGLQYTTYEYGKPEINKVDNTICVSVDITNTGKRTGIETVQCYASYPASEFVRPIRELKQFHRVSLNPGETKKVEFNIEINDLAYFAPDGKLIHSKGKYVFWIGGCSTVTESVTIDI